MYNWKGIPLIYRDFGYEEPHSNKLVHTRSIVSELSDLNVGNAVETVEVAAFGYLGIAQIFKLHCSYKNYTYFIQGYSVTSGYFFNKNEILYVAGAPRSKNYNGQVLLNF